MLTILHGSDLHFGKHLDPGGLEAFREAVEASDPDLVVLSGDFTQRAKVGEYQQARKFLDSLLESTQTTALVMLLIIGAYILMKFLAVSQLTTMMSAFVADLAVPNMVIFAGIVVLYIILGMFLDIISAVILTIPVIFPMVIALGFDPVWYGVMVVILVEMGLVTPPVGMDAFMLAGAIDIPVSKIFRSVAPFLAAEVVCIILLAAFPQIVLWLPGTM